ncbi:hypothetical protein VPH35_066671 [Triticum aestivum]
MLVPPSSLTTERGPLRAAVDPADTVFHGPREGVQQLRHRHLHHLRGAIHAGALYITPFVIVFFFGSHATSPLIRSTSIPSDCPEPSTSILTPRPLSMSVCSTTLKMTPPCQSNQTMESRSQMPSSTMTPTTQEVPTTTCRPLTTTKSILGGSQAGGLRLFRSVSQFVLAFLRQTCLLMSVLRYCCFR